MTVVHADRNRDLDRLLALAEHGDEVRIDLEGRTDAAELLARQLEGVLTQVRRRCDCRQDLLLFSLQTGRKNRTPRRA
jgi:hypothetical protein